MTPMLARPAEAIELLDLSSRLRKIEEWFTFAVNGWQVPGFAGAALGMPSAPPGEETVAELQGLRSRLLELASLEPLADLPWVSDPLERVGEASRLSGMIYGSILERRSEAAAAFHQAAADYSRCNRLADAKDAARRAAELEDAASGNVEAQIAAAQEAVKRTSAGTLDAALHRIELGELLLQAGHTFRARDALRQAESDLADAGYREPLNADAALFGMMSDILGPSGRGSVLSMQQAGEAVKLRVVFHRLYEGLARAHDRIDAQAAAAYREKIKLHRLFTPNPFGP